MSNLCGADHVGTTMWYRCTHFAEHQHHREDGLVREAIWRCFGKARQLRWVNQNGRMELSDWSFLK